VASGAANAVSYPTAKAGGFPAHVAQRRAGPIHHRAHVQYRHDLLATCALLPGREPDCSGVRQSALAKGEAACVFDPDLQPAWLGLPRGSVCGFAASTLRSYRVGSRSSRIVDFFQHLRAAVLPHGWSQGLPGRSFGDHSPCYNKDNAPRKRVGSTSISGVACCKLLTLGALSDVSRAEITTYSVSIMPARSSNKRW